jgi:hypothetical protein
MPSAPPRPATSRFFSATRGLICMSVGGPAAILSARTPFALSTSAMLGGVVRWTFTLFVLLQVVVRIPLVACELRIIDDLHGDLGNSSNQVQYSGHNWISPNSGGGCPFCYGHQLDYSQVVQGSWHYDVDATNLMDISFVGEHKYTMLDDSHS